MLVRRGSCEPAGCPWAWWWLAWRGWRTSSCLQTDQPGKPRWPPEGPSRRSSGSAGRSWSPERSHGPGAERAACGSTARWISGSDGSHGERQFQVGTCEVSSLHLWPARSFALPWWRAVSVEPFLQWISALFVSYVPSFSQTRQQQNVALKLREEKFISCALLPHWLSLSPDLIGYRKLAVRCDWRHAIHGDSKASRRLFRKGTASRECFSRLVTLRESCQTP